MSGKRSAVSGQKSANPFLRPQPGVPHCQITDGQDRIRAIKGMTIGQLQAVIDLPNVQKTVADAARRRLRRLTLNPQPSTSR